MSVSNPQSQPQDTPIKDEMRSILYGASFAVETHPKDFVLRINEKGVQEATQAIKSLIKEIAEDIIGESEQPPIGEMGKFDAQTRTFELDTDTEAVKYHIQRVANQNNLRQSQREKLKGLLK